MEINQKPGLRKFKSGKGIIRPDNYGKGLSRSARKARRGHGETFLPKIRKDQRIIRLTHGYRVI